MQIIVENLGKKFVREWIIRRASFVLETGKMYTFVGPNGSGKSTLLQLLTGMTPPTEGTVIFKNQDGGIIDSERWYKHIVIAAPYMELIEEFTLRELVDFHIQFKPLKEGMSVNHFMEFIQLPQAADKLVRHFSSGMKQRVKLGLAFMSDVPVIFLDEPTTNLDETGIRWYLDHVVKCTENQLVLLGSNVKQEYEFCENIISVSAFK